VDPSNALEVSARIQSQLGWLDLQDPPSGYELDATSFVEHSTTHRKVEVSSGWMEGSYIVRSVRENVSEALVVQVTGYTSAELDAKVSALTDALEQISYQIIVSFDNGQQIWDCSVADYTVTTSRDFRFAKMAIVKATVPRLPKIAMNTIIPGTSGVWLLDDPVSSILDTTTVLT
jgi:hypothetical protein